MGLEGQDPSKMPPLLVKVSMRRGHFCLSSWTSVSLHKPLHPTSLHPRKHGSQVASTNTQGKPSPKVTPDAFALHTTLEWRPPPYLQLPCSSVLTFPGLSAHLTPTKSDSRYERDNSALLRHAAQANPR